MIQILEKNKFFTQNLLKWYAEAHRPMPWKNIKDPYKIWISEIILQQTRVNQGWNYYENFITSFPNIASLAKAPLEKVNKAWEGLGYYTRAANLHKAAIMLETEYGGQFPQDYDKILKLPGIGPYTAAAIASFAFEMPYPVVDGNVMRVLSRYAGIGKDETNFNKIQKETYALANQLIQHAQASVFNQAIMDFGATHCTVSAPKCDYCLLSSKCFAYNNNLVLELPPKKKKIAQKIRYVDFFFIEISDKTIIEKRISKDIWKNLYQVPAYFSDTFNEKYELPNFIEENDVVKHEIIEENIKHVLTHQIIWARFIKISLKSAPISIPEQMIYVDRKNLRNFAFPRLIQKFLQQQHIL